MVRCSPKQPGYAVLAIRMDLRTSPVLRKMLAPRRPSGVWMSRSWQHGTCIRRTCLCGFWLSATRWRAPRTWSLHRNAGSDPAHVGARDRRYLTPRCFWGEGAPGCGGTDNLNSVNNPAEMVVPRVQAAIASAFGEEYRGTDPVVRPSQFADIQINAAMALAKKVGMPPRDAAARIVEALDLDGICSAGRDLRTRLHQPHLRRHLDRRAAQRRVSRHPGRAGGGSPARRRRLFLPERREGNARRPPAHHGGGRQPREGVRGAGRHRDPAEPHRRLGHPVRHADRALAGDRRGLPGGGAAGR